MEDKELKLITTRYPDGTPHAQYLASDLIKIANQYASQYRDWAIQDMSPEEWDGQYSNALSALIDGRLVKFPDGYRFTDGSTEKIHRNVLGTLTAYLSALDEYTPEEKELPSNAELFSEYVAKPLGLNNADELKRYTPNGIHHDQAGSRMASKIKTNILPLVKGTDREQFWNEFYKELENGISELDESYANQLGDKSSGLAFKMIRGANPTQRDLYKEQLKNQYLAQGLTPEQADELVTHNLNAAYARAKKPYDDYQAAEKARKLNEEYQTKFDTHVNAFWLTENPTSTDNNVKNNIATSLSGLKLINYTLDLNKTVQRDAKVKTTDNKYYKTIKAYLEGDYNKALEIFASNGNSDAETKNAKANLYIQRYLNELDVDKKGWVEDTENQIWLLGRSFDIYTGSILAFDPITKNLYRTRLVGPNKLQYMSETYKKIAMDQYKRKFPKNRSNSWNISKDRYGAKLRNLRKFQNGGTSDTTTSNSGNPFEGLYIQTNNPKSDNVPISTTDEEYTPDQIEAIKQGPSDNLHDYVRGTSTALDVVGAGASFIPVYGNVAGAVLGGLGTIGNFAADYMDPTVTSGEMWTNAAINGGLALFNLIPTGGAWGQVLKGASKAKRAKGLAKLGVKAVPNVVLPGYGLYTIGTNWDRLKELATKYEYGNDESLTSEEFRELCYYISLASGTTQNLKIQAGRNAADVQKLFTKQFGERTGALAGKLMAGFGDPFNLLFSQARRIPGMNTSNSRIARGLRRMDAIQTAYHTPLQRNLQISKSTINVHNGQETIQQPISNVAKGIIEHKINQYKTKNKTDQLKGILDETPKIKELLKDITSIYRKDRLPLSESNKNELSNFIKDTNVDDIPEAGLTLTNSNQSFTFNKKMLQQLKNQLVESDTPEDVYNKLLPIAIPEEIQTFNKSLFNTTNIPGTLLDSRSNSHLLELFNNNRGFRFTVGGPWSKINLNRTMSNVIREKLGPFDTNMYSDDILGSYAKYRLNQDGVDDKWIKTATPGEIATKLKSIIDSDDAEFNRLDIYIKENINSKNNSQSNNKQSNNNVQHTNDEGFIGILDEDNNQYVGRVTEQSSGFMGYIDNFDQVPRVTEQSSDIIASSTTSRVTNNSKQKSNRQPKKKKKKHEQGGSINPLKELRQNFTTDTINKFSRGGIIKAQQGEKLDNWYTRLWTYKKLKEWDSNKDKSHAGNLKDTRYHNKSGDIDTVYNFNNEYINSGKVGEDIQFYYNSLDDDSITPEAFVQNYNDLLKIVNDRFNNEVTYGTLGAKEGNEAHKKLFNSQYNPNNQNIYLSWNPQILDIWGTTSWLRRGDRYEKELNALSSEELAGRTFDITAKNGQSFKVYKKANGELTLQVEPQKKSDVDDEEETPQYGNLLSDQIERDGTDGNLENDYKPQQTVLEDYYFDPYAIGLQKAYPELLDISRYLKNLRNNQRVLELGLKKRINLKAPLQLHRNTYGDFGALMQSQKFANQLRSKADDIAGNTINTESGAAAQLDTELKAQQQEMTGRDRDNQMMRQSANESQQMAENLYKYNKEIGEQNMDKIVAHENYKLDLKAAKDSADTTNYNSFSMGKEQRARQDAADLKEKIEKIRMLRLEQDKREYLTNTPKIKQLYKQLYATTDPDKKMEILDQIEQLKHEYQRAYGPYFFDEYIRILLGDYSRGRLPSEVQVRTPQPTITKKTRTEKKGGKLYNHNIKKRGEDLKELRKQIRHNITTNQKALDNLSKATLLELKKMMDI